MYRIKCDEYPLLDFRDERLIVSEPRVVVEVNTVGGASFTIHSNHPYYDKLKKLKSIFEISDEIGVIFRGRMTEDSKDFYNSKAVDIEGAMAFFNDSIVAPFDFPNDFENNKAYITAAESGNVVKFFLNLLIENHNAQVQDFQKFKLGTVTVSDKNNYIKRSSTDVLSTWEVLKTKLFESSIGGKLCIRYEDDGNYIDYLSDFTLTNSQEIKFGENLLDLIHDSDAKTTYSALIPFGAEIERNNETQALKLSLASISDGLVSDDVYKITLNNGLHALYSKSAVDNCGWICAPVEETTWEDVNELQNLLTKSKTWLLTQGSRFKDTIEIIAFDLHLTDEQVRSFRIYRKINVDTKIHGIKNSYDLTKLDIDIMNSENTKFTLGETKMSLIDQSSNDRNDVLQKIEETETKIEDKCNEVNNEVLSYSQKYANELIESSTEETRKLFAEYTTIKQLEELTERIETQFKQTSDSFDFSFTTINERLTKENGDILINLEEIKKYIRFVDGNIILGESGNEMTTKISNGRISFLYNDVLEVAYISENKLYITQAEVLDQIVIGKFAFTPRSNGNLSFKKIR